MEVKFPPKAFAHSAEYKLDDEMSRKTNTTTLLFCCCTSHISYKKKGKYICKDSFFLLTVHPVVQNLPHRQRRDNNPASF